MSDPIERLDHALAEMRTQRLSADEYLSAQPQAADLAPLLRAADEARRAGADLPGLSPARAAAGEAGLLAHYRAKRRRAARAPMWRLAFALALVALILLSGAGTVAAAGQALPGEALYPVKRFVEGAQFSLAAPEERPALQIRFAAARLEEYTALAALGVFDPGALSEVESATQAALEAAEQAPAEEQTALAAQIADLATHQQEVLTAVKDKAPEAAQKGLEQAIESSAKHQARALGIIQHSSPSATPTAGGSQPAPAPTETLNPGQSRQATRTAAKATPRPTDPAAT